MRRGVIAGLCLAGFAGVAAAETGRAPVRAGTYVSIEGGYQLLEGEPARAYGYSPAAGVHLGDVLVDSDTGWFGGIGIGYAARAGAVLGLFDRVELSLGHARSHESRATQGDGLALASVDATAIAMNAGAASAKIERQAWDIAAALKTSSGMTTWSLEPFLRLSDDETTQGLAGAGGSVFRSGKVAATFVGVMAAVEPEIALAPAISLVGRLGAGVYGYRASGKFRSWSPDTPFFDAAVDDSASGAGLRGSLGAALKLAFSPSSTLTTYIGVDYWSRVPSLSMTDQDVNTIDPSHLKGADLWDGRAGVRLSFGLGQ